MEQISARLIERGAPVQLALAEIAAAQASPYFQASGLLTRRLAKRDWLLATYRKLARDGGLLAEVPRVAALPADGFFADYYAAHRPAILTGLIDAWPALTRWSLDHFETTLGDRMIEVQAGRASDPGYEMRSNHHKAMLPLAQVIARMRDGPSNDFYITANNGAHNRAALDPLWADIGALPGYLDPGSAQDGFFWMGPQGTITPFHHDLTNNLLVQIVGTKRVSLVPSWDTPLMRNMRHCYSEWTSPAQIAALDDAARPGIVTCDLNPGEILFIPVGWWHYVEGLTPTIGMSFVNFARDNDHYSGYSSYERL